MDLLQSAVRARSVTKAFGGARGVPRVEVLRGVDLDVPRGAMVSIVGPSGCGKSTLLFCLSGLDRPDDGTVELLGADLLRLRPGAVAALHRDAVGMVFQSANLVASLSATDNVLLPARLARRRVGTDRAVELLTGLGLGARARTRAALLSVGEQQRVALARVLLAAPDLVLADEPTGALDSPTSDLVLTRLRAHADGSRTVVLVTHDLDAACRADVVLVMRDGQIVDRLQDATPASLVERMVAA